MISKRAQVRLPRHSSNSKTSEHMPPLMKVERRKSISCITDHCFPVLDPILQLWTRCTGNLEGGQRGRRRKKAQFHYVDSWGEDTITLSHSESLVQSWRDANKTGRRKGEKKAPLCMSRQSSLELELSDLLRFADCAYFDDVATAKAWTIFNEKRLIDASGDTIPFCASTRQNPTFKKLSC
jgi:hypothetical protein